MSAQGPPSGGSPSDAPTPPASIVRPGATPEGPPGWEEQRVAQAQAQAQAEGGSGAGAGAGAEGRAGVGDVSNGQADKAEHEGIGQKLKDQVHKVGEKLAFVPPKDGESRQDASTMPEVPIE